MDSRQHGGRETRHRLLEWDRGQADSERLATRLLSNENYSKVDPSHPLGGKDGGKDAFLEKDGSKLILAVYFPRGQKTMKEITAKFREDFKGVKKNNVNGIVFFTNQEIKLDERKTLRQIAKNCDVELYHLETISNLLDIPTNYGLRLEFLQINMRHEEMLAFYAQRDGEYLAKLSAINNQLESSVKNIIGNTTGGDSFLGIEISAEFIFLRVFGEYPIRNIALKVFDLRLEELRKESLNEKAKILVENTKERTAELVESLTEIIKMEFIRDESSVIITSLISFLDTKNVFVIDTKKILKRALGEQKYCFEVISSNGTFQITLLAQYTVNFLEVLSEIIVEKDSVILRKTINNQEVSIEN